MLLELREANYNYWLHRTTLVQAHILQQISAKFKHIVCKSVLKCILMHPYHCRNTNARKIARYFCWILLKLYKQKNFVSLSFQTTTVSKVQEHLKAKSKILLTKNYYSQIFTNFVPVVSQWVGGDMHVCSKFIHKCFFSLFQF